MFQSAFATLCQTMNSQMRDAISASSLEEHTYLLLSPA